MGTVVMGALKRGDGCPDVSNVLHRGGSGGATLWFVVVGHVRTDWEVSRVMSPSSDMATYYADATVERGHDLGVPFHGGGDGGGLSVGDRNLHHPLPEHCCVIYYDKANYVPASGSGAALRGKFRRGVGSKRLLILRGFGR